MREFLRFVRNLNDSEYCRQGYSEILESLYLSIIQTYDYEGYLSENFDSIVRGKRWYIQSDVKNFEKEVRRFILEIKRQLLTRDDCGLLQRKKCHFIYITTQINSKS